MACVSATKPSQKWSKCKNLHFDILLFGLWICFKICKLQFVDLYQILSIRRGLWKFRRRMIQHDNVSGKCCFVRALGGERKKKLKCRFKKKYGRNKKNPRTKNFCILILHIMKKKVVSICRLKQWKPHKTRFFCPFFHPPLNFSNYDVLEDSVSLSFCF